MESSYLIIVFLDVSDLITKDEIIYFPLNDDKQFNTSYTNQYILSVFFFYSNSHLIFPQQYINLKNV